jgi:hypothetical protein
MSHPNLGHLLKSLEEEPGSEQGVRLDDLADGAVLQVETQRHQYSLVKQADTHVRVSGYPTLCPEPVEMEVEGSIGSGSLSVPNPGFIGRGMYLVLKHPVFDRITTSQIRGIRVLG